MQQFSEHIDQLLDGELDPMLEQTLYAELATNADLRTEMRDQIALKAAVKDDRMALVPPAALTSSVFSTLGLATGMATAGAVGGSVAWQWLTRLGLPVLSALTAAGVSWSVSQNAFTKFVAETGAQVEAPAEQQAPDLTSQLIALRQENASLLQELAARPEREVVREVVRVVEREAEPEVKPEVESDVDPMPLAVGTSNIDIVNSIELQRDPTPQTIRLATADLALRPPTRRPFSAQVRGMSLTPSLSTAVSEQSAWYNNLGLAVMYSMNERSALGFEVGNEAYPMIFEGDRNGQVVRYEQYPSTVWAGVTYRFTGSVLGALPLQPYGQVLVGGSKFGPMGRMQAGLQYAPAGPLVFLLGVEGSAMTFTYQNAWYVSPKFGLTYGMALRF